jgi:hypothetical protein
VDELIPWLVLGKDVHIDISASTDQLRSNAVIYAGITFKEGTSGRCGTACSTVTLAAWRGKSKGGNASDMLGVTNNYHLAGKKEGPSFP